MQVHKNFALSLAVMFSLLLALYWVSPNGRSISQFKLPPDQVNILNPHHTLLSRQLRVDEAQVSKRQQFRPRQTKPRQFTANVNAVDNPQAVYIPVLGGPANVFFNGIPIASTKERRFTGFAYGASSLYGPISIGHYNSNRNRLDTIATDDQFRTGIREIYHGDANTLKQAHDHMNIWISSARSLALYAGIIGVICSFIGFIFGKHRLIYFSAFLLSALVFFQAYTPQPMRFITQFPVFPALLFLLTSAVFTYALTKSISPYKWLIQGFAWTACLAAICTGLLVLSPFYFNHSMVMTHIANIGALPFLFAGVPILFISDISEFRRALLHSQQDAHRKDLIIKQQDASLHQEIKDKTILQERQRFMRDMHDGIGGQLLSLLVRMRAGRVDLQEVEGEIQSGLNDLRLVVDSLDHVGDDLGAALATFHARAQAQLDSKQISLSWSQSETLEINHFKTRQILNLYRFMQEALSNILRHAQAQNVGITIQQNKAENVLTLTIEDDGIGIDETKNKQAGKGLNNMKARAFKLGGAVEFKGLPQGTGTIVHLKVPLMGHL